MAKIIEDIALLTNVTENTLEKFIPICKYCIGHNVHENLCQKKDITEIDFGFGVLNIKIDDCEIRYKFIPSKELEDVLVKTITQHTSPIITKLENNLQEKLDRTYKELL